MNSKELQELLGQMERARVLGYSTFELAIEDEKVIAKKVMRGTGELENVLYVPKGVIIGDCEKPPFIDTLKISKGAVDTLLSGALFVPLFATKSETSERSLYGKLLTRNTWNKRTEKILYDSEKDLEEAVQHIVLYGVYHATSDLYGEKMEFHPDTEADEEYIEKLWHVLPHMAILQDDFEMQMYGKPIADIDVFLLYIDKAIRPNPKSIGQCRKYVLDFLGVLYSREDTWNYTELDKLIFKSAVEIDKDADNKLFNGDFLTDKSGWGWTTELKAKHIVYKFSKGTEHKYMFSVLNVLSDLGIDVESMVRKWCGKSKSKADKRQFLYMLKVLEVYLFCGETDSDINWEYTETHKKLIQNCIGNTFVKRMQEGLFDNFLEYATLDYVQQYLKSELVQTQDVQKRKRVGEETHCRQYWEKETPILLKFLERSASIGKSIKGGDDYVSALYEDAVMNGEWFRNPQNDAMKHLNGALFVLKWVHIENSMQEVLKNGVLQQTNTPYIVGEKVNFLWRYMSEVLGQEERLQEDAFYKEQWMGELSRIKEIDIIKYTQSVEATTQRALTNLIEKALQGNNQDKIESNSMLWMILSNINNELDYMMSKMYSSVLLLQEHGYWHNYCEVMEYLEEVINIIQDTGKYELQTREELDEYVKTISEKDIQRTQLGGMSRKLTELLAERQNKLLVNRHLK